LQAHRRGVSKLAGEIGDGAPRDLFEIIQETGGAA
jgi:hypothetical protein